MIWKKVFGIAIWLHHEKEEMIITLKEYEYGGKIEVYAQVDQTTDDFARIYACCDYFAKQGAKTLIYPHFTETVTNADYVSIFASLRYTRYWGKCPDFTVNGVWYEHEGYDKSKDLTNPNKRADTFSKMLALCAAHVMNRGIKQSERIIVEDCQVGRRWAKKNIYNRVHSENQNIVEVYIRTDNGLETLYTRAEQVRSKKEAG